MTQLIHSINEWQTIRKSIQLNKTIGFVPTLGHLHRGHLSLLERSINENDVTVLSIFVNPLQFDRKDDFNRYPRTLEKDMTLAKQVGVDYLLLFKVEEMYSDGFRYQIIENQLSKQLEGASRPGHFSGVLTVVMKFFLLVKPNRAYFGEKDYQQLQLVKQLVDVFFLEIDVVPCLTIREPSGLPLSSRNSLLTADQRKRAALFAKIFHSQASLEQIKQRLTEQHFKIDYLTEQDGRRFIALWVDDIRLIDNVRIN